MLVQSTVIVVQSWNIIYYVTILAFAFAFADIRPSCLYFIYWTVLDLHMINSNNNNNNNSNRLVLTRDYNYSATEEKNIQIGLKTRVRQTTRGATKTRCEWFVGYRGMVESAYVCMYSTYFGAKCMLCISRARHWHGMDMGMWCGGMDEVGRVCNLP